MEQFSSIAGWIGTGLIVLAYFLVSTKRFTGTNKWYQLMNIAGSVGVGINVYYQHAWPSVVLQILWICIGLYSLTHNMVKAPQYHKHGHHPQHVVAKGHIPE